MKIRNFADDSELFNLVQDPKIAPRSQDSGTGDPSIFDDRRSIIQPSSTKPPPPPPPSSSSLLYWLVHGPIGSAQWMQSLVAFRMLQLILNTTIKIIATIPIEYQLNCLEIVDSTRIVVKKAKQIKQSSSTNGNVESSNNKNNIRSSSLTFKAQQPRKLIRRPMNFIIVMLLVCLCTSFCGYSMAHPLGDGPSTQPNYISKLINMNGYHPNILVRSEDMANQPPQDSMGSNAMKLQMLNQLRINREQHRRAHHNSQSRLTDPIFDPNFEELSLDPNEPQADYGGASVMPLMVEQYKTTTHFNENNQTKRKTLGQENDDNSLDSATKLFGTPVNGFGELSLEDQNESVKEIIKSGWIQHSSTKKLLYYLRKLDEILFKDAEYDLDFDVSPMSDSLKTDPDQDSLGTEDDDLQASKSHSMPKQQALQQQQQPDELKRGGEQNTSNKDWEIIMDRIMNTPNTMKKRGEGPQLSIDYPLTVLRQRLIAELARRKAKETEEQIAINTEILKKLGRRKRSVQTNKIIDCDQIDCKLQDLNLKKSNVLQTLLKNDQIKKMNGVSGKFSINKWNVKRNPSYKIVYYQQPSEKSKFRANDKYYMMDKWIAQQQTEPEDAQTMADMNNPNLADYYNQEMLNDVVQPKLRFNSKKMIWPVFNRLNERQIAGPLFDSGFWKQIKRANNR